MLQAHLRVFRDVTEIPLLLILIITLHFCYGMKFEELAERVVSFSLRPVAQIYYKLCSS